jgi:hypothetical protein
MLSILNLSFDLPISWPDCMKRDEIEQVGEPSSTELGNMAVNENCSFITQNSETESGKSPSKTDSGRNRRN